MSTPQGHPDYQDYAIWRGPLTVSSFQSITSAQAFILQPNLNLTNFNGVVLFVSVAAGIAVTVQAGFAGGPVNTPTYFWRVLPGQQLFVLLPAATNKFFLQVGTSQPGTAHFNLLVAPSNTPVNRPTYLNQDNVVSAVARPLAANTSIAFNLPYVQEGELMLSSAETDVSNALIFQVLELAEDGSILRIPCVRFPGTISGVTTLDRVLVGPNPVQVSVFNTDVANPHTFYLTGRMVAAAHG